MKSRELYKLLLLTATLLGALMPFRFAQAELIQKLSWDEGLIDFGSGPVPVETTGEAILKFDQLSGTNQNLISCPLSFSIGSEFFESDQCQAGVFAMGPLSAADSDSDNVYWWDYTIDPSTGFFSATTDLGIPILSWPNLAGCSLPGPGDETPPRAACHSSSGLQIEALIVPVQEPPIWLLAATGVFLMGLRRRWGAPTSANPEPRILGGLGFSRRRKLH